MMRILKGILPNVTIALNIALFVVYYLDMRNPMMGFLVGTPFYTLGILAGICSIATAVFFYISIRKNGNVRANSKKEQNEA